MKKTIAGIIGIVIIGIVAVSYLAPPVSAQTETQRYSFARYDNLTALAKAGIAPTRLGLALIEGGASRFGGQGRFYVWEETSTTSTNGSTNGYTVVAATGVTTGRWKSLNTGWLQGLTVVAGAVSLPGALTVTGTAGVTGLTTLSNLTVTGTAG